MIVTKDNYKEVLKCLDSVSDENSNDVVLDFCSIHRNSIEFVSLIPKVYKFKNSRHSGRIKLENFDSRYLQTRDLELPRHLRIEPTTRCNLKCPYCSRNFLKIAPREDLSFLDFKKIIDNYKTSPDISLWGMGEPLLNSDIFKMVAHAKERGCRKCDISTNSYFISKENILLFFTSRLDELILAIDGASEETYLRHRKGGDFNKVIKNVYQLCKFKRERGFRRPNIVIQFIVTAYNEQEIPRMRVLSKKLGVDKLVLKNISVDGERTHFIPNNIQYNRYGSEVQRSEWCPALWDSAAISSEGDVTLCCKMFPIADKVNFGNVFKTDLNSIWNGKEYQYCRKLMLEGKKDQMEHCDITCPAGQKVVSGEFV
ncbi:MAG: radical SAM protein [Candidatus Omnitrophota bacterium]